jgi:hypothetical protein
MYLKMSSAVFAANPAFDILSVLNVPGDLSRLQRKRFAALIGGC